MTCAEFLERYTDFRDGLITAPRELRRFERHLVRRAAREVPASAGVAAALVLAAALAMLALEGVRRPEVAHAPVLPPVPFPHPVVQAGMPFVSFQDPRAGVFAGPQATDGAAFVEPASAGR